MKVALPNYTIRIYGASCHRHDSGHGGSHTFLTAEFINALVEDRRPSVDVYKSSLKDGEQLEVPQFDKQIS